MLKKCFFICKEIGNWKLEEFFIFRSRLCRGGAFLLIFNRSLEVEVVWGEKKVFLFSLFCVFIGIYFSFW